MTGKVKENNKVQIEGSAYSQDERQSDAIRKQTYHDILAT